MRREARDAREVATDVASVAEESVSLLALLFNGSSCPPPKRAARARRLRSGALASVGLEDVDGAEEAIGPMIRSKLWRLTADNLRSVLVSVDVCWTPGPGTVGLDVLAQGRATAGPDRQERGERAGSGLFYLFFVRGDTTRCLEPKVADHWFTKYEQIRKRQSLT
jgi:hypothetical protein